MPPFAQQRTPDELLIAAAKGQDTAKVLALIAQGADVNYRDSEGDTALHMIVVWGRDTVALEALLKAGANPDVQDNIGFTPLHNAGISQFPMVRMLLEYGANPHLLALNNTTPVHQATPYLCPDNMQALIEAKVNLDVQANDGTTALMMAAEYSRTECVATLLDAGADLRLTDNEGKTAFDIAREKNRTDVIALFEAHIEAHRRFVIEAGWQVHENIAVDFSKAVRPKLRRNSGSAVNSTGAITSTPAPRPASGPKMPLGHGDCM